MVNEKNLATEAAPFSILISSVFVRVFLWLVAGLALQRSDRVAGHD
jgi:hypothetical protein